VRRAVPSIAVHDVIEIGRELVNVFAIERRNKRAVEPVDDLMRDLIGLVLQPLDRFDVGRCVGRAPPGRAAAKCSTASLLRVGDFGEQIEKLFFARQETHGISGGEGGPQR